MKAADEWFPAFSISIQAGLNECADSLQIRPFPIPSVRLFHQGIGISLRIHLGMNIGEHNARQNDTL